MAQPGTRLRRRNATSVTKRKRASMDFRDRGGRFMEILEK